MCATAAGGVSGGAKWEGKGGVVGGGTGTGFEVHFKNGRVQLES